jgi:hypothetical protein
MMGRLVALNEGLKTSMYVPKPSKVAKVIEKLKRKLNVGI